MAHFGDHQVVRYGVPIKLVHIATEKTLHSHLINYPTGSHQQEVTCFHERDDNDWWIIKGPDGNGRFNCPIGGLVLNHSIVRLEHMLTGRNLHSHNGFHSPATHQGEVTAYGEFGIGDANDNWRLEIHDRQPGMPWRINEKIRLVHIATNHALHSHQGHATPGSHQQEVTAFGQRDANDFWTIEILS